MMRLAFLVHEKHEINLPKVNYNKSTTFETKYFGGMLMHM